MIKALFTIGSIAVLQIALLQLLPEFNLYYLAFLSLVTCSLVWIVARQFKKQELVAQEKKVSDAIINSLPGIFYLYDRDHQFIRWNNNFEVVSGYTGEHFSKLQPLDFFQTEEKELLKDKIDAVFENGRDEVEAMLLTCDGRRIPYYFNGSLATLDGKDYLIGMGIDITRIKVAEKKVLDAYKENEITLNRISDAVVSLDPQWRYTFLNDAALTTHPGGRAATIGKPILEVHPEMDGTPFWNMYQEAMRVMKVMQVESYYDPMKTWFSATAYPSTSGLTIFYQDITERKLAEKQKLDLILKLQNKNKDLRKFSYIVSHNLRAPVAKIAGLGDLLGEAPDDQQQIVDLIVKETKQLDQVVMDMNLIVAARRSEQATAEEVYFASIIDQATKSLEDEIKKTHAVIQATLEVPCLFTIKSYIETIVYNLISNAIKFGIPNIQPIIKISTTLFGDFICLSVTDNGRGVDLQQNKEKLFGLYKRFHTDIPGRGVGLTLTKVYAETLGGRVEVESELNKGSTFKVFLPSKYIPNHE